MNIIFVISPKIKLGLPVVHLENRAHWVLASNIGCDNSHLNVYDSVFSSGDEELLDVLTRLFDFETHICWFSEANW